MAERRMFAKTIIDSDAFLDMPMSARLLYYDLAMRADDDGFVNSPKKIMRITGASQQDLEVLKADKFILPFEDKGIVVIKHWFIHNYIRKDMYKETNYKEEKALLCRDENNAYTFNVTDSLQVRNETVTSTSTQDRLGKDRLGKDRLGEVRLREDATEVASSQSEPIDYQSIVDDFNSICIDYPKVKSLSDKRKKTIRARLNTYSREELRYVFEKAQSSDFLKGKNNRDWQANFDWLLKDASIAKVLDGNYDNKNKASGNTKAQELDDFYKMASDWAKG